MNEYKQQCFFDESEKMVNPSNTCMNNLLVFKDGRHPKCQRVSSLWRYQGPEIYLRCIMFVIFFFCVSAPFLSKAQIQPNAQSGHRDSLYLDDDGFGSHKKNNTDKNKKINACIEIRESKYLVEISLFNYDTAKIDHDKIDSFLNIIVRKIHNIGSKQRVSVRTVGYADGLAVDNLKMSSLNICCGCSKIVRTEKVSNKDLARLRGCIIKERLREIFSREKNLAKLDNLVDHEDNKIGGYYRKVTVVIKKIDR